MNNVEYFCGSKDIVSSPLQPFNQDAVTFLNEVSRVLFKSPETRHYPDLSTFAFWCRKNNILKLKTNYNEIATRLGRGLCFHITPSNIPINFAFSFVFALLAGNANLVRLPTKFYPQVNFLLEIIKDVIKKYPEIETRTAFVKYPRTSADTTLQFSSLADCRMIWGGDQTINMLTRLPVKPRCVDLTFSDRYSLAVINAKKVITSNEVELTGLARNFYNDTYLIDQNACSSPQLICWINNIPEARDIFWNAVHDVASRKYNLQDAVAIDKYTKLCLDSIKINDANIATVKTNLLYRIELLRLPSDLDNLRGVSGYFYEYSLNNYSELLSVVNEKYQTVTYFGIDPCGLRKELFKNHIKGIDRIVPVGKSLDISIVWDGYDLIRELSRLCVVE